MCIAAQRRPWISPPTCRSWPTRRSASSARGAKSILDLGATLEYLETQGVPVLGLRTDELPAFYCRTSGFKLDYNCQDEETVAKIMKAKWDIGLKGGAVVGNPIPEQYAMDPNYMNGIIDQAPSPRRMPSTSTARPSRRTCWPTSRT